MKQIALAMCLDNEGYEASLELLKVYPVVKPEGNDPKDYMRIVDESGEDYLYPTSAFEIVTFPPRVKRRIAEAIA
jgi:hypothetical protein